MMTAYVELICIYVRENSTTTRRRFQITIIMKRSPKTCIYISGINVVRWCMNDLLPVWVVAFRNLGRW